VDQLSRNIGTGCHESSLFLTPEAAQPRPRAR
jgi:hypothetical protein